MKFKRILIIFAVMIFGTFVANAEADGYIVKFKTTPSGLDTTIFKEIIAEEGLYEVASLGYLDGYKDFIEYTEKDAPIDISLPDEPEPKVSLMSVPSDNIYPEQWALNMVKADYAWANETYGNEVRVAVLDSGCYPHGDLGDNLLTGKNYLDNTSDTSDDHGHGTHVSGIIAAGINNRGTVGVAPKVKIVPIKIMSASDSCNTTQIARAIRDSVDVYGCKVLNMSWGTSKSNNTLNSALNYAYGKGAILVAAVGNDGIADLSYPAAYNNVIGVASVDSEKVKSDFSRYNDSVDIAAPGTRVLSLYTENRYAYMNGTSQASPHIAGIAALALSADSTITPAEFYTLLTETAEDLGDAGYDNYYGYGLVDTEALMNRIFKKRSIYISPMNSENGENYLLIRNTGKSPLTAQSIFTGSNGARFTSATSTPVSLMPDETVIVSTDISSPRHFLWNSFLDMKPIAKQK